MRIVFLEVDNFRGIRKLRWAPAAGVNCLMGPGDSTKTTILDAIELVLNPRSYLSANDYDFFGAAPSDPITITVTLANLPPEFLPDDRYGLQLRGWNEAEAKVEDEPREGIEEALSVRVFIDQSLDVRWFIFTERTKDDPDPRGIRFKDARLFATTRLGPYADRHLGWGRSSVLTRIGETKENFNLQLAQASRAARATFKQTRQDVFSTVVARVEELGKLFGVAVRDKYAAALDVEAVNISTGGIALHDGDLPVRSLGTGSSRLLVSALQHDAGPSHIALIDEIEHGLEPHRIARLLRHLTKTEDKDQKRKPAQIFMTTHSPVVIRELNGTDIFAVRSSAGETTVTSVAGPARGPDLAQAHLRRSPEAFLARRIAVGEGKTECGLLRGLDQARATAGKDSFALQGVVPIDGTGDTKACLIAEHLADLGYGVLLLLDSDGTPNADDLARARKKAEVVIQWADGCSTEERIFLDVPWCTVQTVIQFAREVVGDDSVKHWINSACKASGLAELQGLELPTQLNKKEFRRALGVAAKNGKWFKDIARGERLGVIVVSCLDEIQGTDLASAIAKVRAWVDG